MLQFSRKTVLLLFLCLSVAVATVAEDQSDGFVPATGNETQTSAPVVTTPSSDAASNVDAASAAESSGSQAVSAAVSDLSSALDTFFKALKTFFDALSQLFSSIFGGSANAAEVASTGSSPAASPETQNEAGAGTAVRPNASQTAQTPVSPASQTASPTTSGQAASQTPSGQQADQNGVSISDAGREQMKRLIAYAKSHHGGGSNGDCFNFVWRYLTSSGYGKLRNWGDLPNMKSTYARHFAEYLNGGQSRLDEAGLQRLDSTLNPPITNPHDPRIPDGAVIVVAAGSYGTSDPVAGDIVVKAGPGHFINDGPNMDYGTKSSWYGKLLGVYVPK